MAIIMMHNNDIDTAKSFTDEQKANEGKTICPIMSPEIIKWKGSYAACVKELCALWDDGRCAFARERKKNKYEND